MLSKREIVATLQERELNLLKSTHDGRGTYCTRRNIVADLAKPYIDSLLVKKQPEILEVGCGSGNALLKIASNHPQLNPSNLTGTSLNELPEHKLLKQSRINLRIPVVAELLSETFSSQFDIVLASAVLQWTDVPVVVNQIDKLLPRNGLLIGFDQRPVVACLHYHSRSFMESLLSCQQVHDWECRAHGLIAFVMRKK